MGLDIDAKLRKQFLERYGALASDDTGVGKLSCAAVDVPASVRKKVRPGVEMSPKLVAQRLLSVFGKNVSSLFFAFDTDSLHHPMRKLVALKRGLRKPPRGLSKYPPGMARVWTIESEISLERAMLDKDSKAAYYGVLCDALKQASRELITDAPVTIEIDGPRLDDQIWRCHVHAKTDDGRSKIEIETVPRSVNYGEADLKVQHYCLSTAAVPEGGGTIAWHTIDTDSICQTLLSKDRLDARGRRVVIHFPSMGKDKPPTYVDSAKLPGYNAVSLAFCLLLAGCDYSESALGFGFQPAKILLESAAPVPFDVNEKLLRVDRDGLVALLRQLSVGAPRKLYLCSAGKRHKSRVSATNASEEGFKVREIPRTIQDLSVAIQDILRVIWYWKLNGSTRTPAGPPENFEITADALFGCDATLQQVMAGDLDTCTLPIWQISDAEARRRSDCGSPARSLSPDILQDDDMEWEATKRPSPECAGPEDTMKRPCLCTATGQ